MLKYYVSLIFVYRTLYCAKGNYDFGISRVIKSLEPYNKKVCVQPAIHTLLPSTACVG